MDGSALPPPPGGDPAPVAGVGRPGQPWRRSADVPGAPGPRRRRRRWAAVVVGAALVAGSGVLAVGGRTPAHADDLTHRQQVLAQALTGAQADLDTASVQTRQAAAALSAVAAELPAARARVAAAVGQLAGAQAVADVAARQAASARAEAADAATAVAGATAAVAARRSAVAQLAAVAYERGPQATLTTFFAAPDQSAWLEYDQLLAMASRGEQGQLAALGQAEGLLAAQQAVLLARSADARGRAATAAAALLRVQNLVAAAGRAETRVAALIAVRSHAFATAEAGLQRDRARLSVLAAESDQVAALLRARLAAAAASAASRTSGTPVLGVGGLLWPADGPLTSRYGYRRDPYTGRVALHAGIDIGAAYGAAIHAALTGTVVFAGQETGYGNYTCIDHGGGFATCYAHQSFIGVGVGERVVRGQVIGRVGSTGYSTGPHLHFETRINGNPVDPLRYFPGYG